MDAIESTHPAVDTQQNEVGVIGSPPIQLVGALWLIIVCGLVAFVLGGALAMYVLLASGKDPKEVVPLITAVIGVLAGLLVPSPVAKS